MTDVADDPRLGPAVAMLGRTGAQEFQLRYSDDQQPVVWMALAQWHGHWEAMAALDPLQAVFRLCERVIDGGRCTHCQRPSAFTADFEPVPLDQLFCWYQWDPELETFRRGCE